MPETLDGRRYRMLFDRASIGVGFIDLDGSIRSVNARMCEILGYERAELEAMTCLDITHPDELAAHADLFARALAGDRTTVSTEKRLLRKDGSAVWTEIRLTILCDERGAPEQFAAIVDDIGERIAVERTIAESESLLRFAGEMAHFGGWAYDVDDGSAIWSGEVRSMFGIPAEYSPTLADVLAFYRPESSQRLASALEEATRVGGSFDLELETIPRPRVPSWIRVVGRFDATNRRFAGAVQDISVRKHSELELVRINRALKMLSGCNEVLVRATDERTLLTDIARLVVEVGGYHKAWVGYARDDERKSVEPMAVAGHDDAYFSGATRITWLADDPSGNGGAGRTIRSGRPTIVKDVATDPSFEPWRDEALARGYRGVICLPLAEGGRVFGILCLYSATVVDPQRAEVDLLTELADDLAFGIGHLRARAQRDAAEREIEYLAFYDTLTKLPNRVALVQRLKAMLGPGCETGALLFIDLDNFKTLNDTLGHDMGDALLRQVAGRLQAAARPGDVVARFGGDEFVVLVDRLGDDVASATIAARAIAERVLATFATPYEIDGRAHATTPSIGVTIFTGADHSDDILKAADLAMYRAKAAGRNAIRFFDPAMQAAATARRALEDDVRAALRERQFALVYQPQVDLAGRIVGAEALVRWTHCERGPVSPSEFIPIAEESGLIVALGRSVLQMACARLASWSHGALRDLRLSVNVSAREFRHPDFVGFVCETLAATGADPHRLTLELTESVFADDVDALVAKMDALRAVGIAFSLDDFGTGYSSLSYLKRLPLGQLKIDQSFVRDVLVDPGDAVIARTIVALGKNLSLDVVAEGVENVDQFRLLADSGCRLFQGFHFHRPLTADALERAVVDRVSEIFTPS